MNGAYNEKWPPTMNIWTPRPYGHLDWLWSKTHGHLEWAPRLIVVKNTSRSPRMYLYLFEWSKNTNFLCFFFLFFTSVLAYTSVYSVLSNKYNEYNLKEHLQWMVAYNEWLPTMNIIWMAAYNEFEWTSRLIECLNVQTSKSMCNVWYCVVIIVIIG